jgi:hypothetical protein
MVKLEQARLTQRLIRKDYWPELGVSTLNKAIEAIDAGRKEEAKALVQYLWTEPMQLHDGFTDWLWLFYTMIGNEGEEKLTKYYEQTNYSSGFFDMFLRGSVEESVQHMAELMRGHGSGPGRLGDIAVRDEGDKYVVEADPCGSGGRMRRGDTLGGPRAAAPFNYLVVKKAYPWTWGKTGVPAYCTHCAALEIASVERFGYPIFVTEYSDDPWQPCRYIFYKDPEAIPERYFTRLGKSKPTPRK